jgi:glycosyltransferase involved in cell wall biosynthesis
MRVVLTLLVRDEADIIRSNVEYHLAQGIDHVVVTDNGSVDGTVDILVDLARSGRVTLEHEAPADFSQHRWVTQMARRAAGEFRADWVINADADELFVSRGGTLRDALSAVPATVHAMYAGRHDFVPFENCQGATQQGMIYRKRVSTNLRGDPLPPKVIHRADSGVVVSQGNHEASGPLLQNPPLWSDIEVFHYPIRSYRQFESKVRNAGSGYSRNRELSADIGFHKRQWYALLQTGGLERLYWETYYFDRSRLAKSLESGALEEDPIASARIGR